MSDYQNTTDNPSTDTRTFRILITGTRNPLSSAQAALVADTLDLVIGSNDGWMVLVHGACPTGVDALVNGMYPADFATVEQHPADWKAHGRAAGPLRNREMVAAGADVCLAFPMGASRGTRGCIALAQAAGIPTTVVEL